MLDGLGRWVHRRRAAVLVAWAVLVVAGAVLGGSVFDSAEDLGGRAGAESTTVEQRLDALDTDGEQVVVLLSGADPLDPASYDATSAAVYAVRELPGVVDLRDPWTTSAYELVAEDGSSALVEIDLDPALSDDEALALADRIGAVLEDAPFPEVDLGGDLLAERTFTDQAVQDAARGEGAALLVLVVLLTIALGSIVAGLLPVASALAAVAVALLALAGATRVTSVSDFAVNVVTVLGLGLCVDYSLLVVARFREERAAAGRAPDLAAVLGRTVATAGRTVLVSGVTVGSALAALLLLGDPLLTGMAVGGLVAVGVVTAVGLLLVPALLSVCHTRVPDVGRGAFGRPARAPERSVLARLARFAQARPWPVLVVSTGVLVALAAPCSGCSSAPPMPARSRPAARRAPWSR